MRVSDPEHVHVLLLQRCRALEAMPTWPSFWRSLNSIFAVCSACEAD